MNSTPGTEIIEVASGIYARLHENLTNAGIIVGDEGVLIIDSLRMPSFARDLISDVKLITDKPVKYVIDTHAHWDHSWGNEEFPDATIIGHQNCYVEMMDDKWNEQWRSKIVTGDDPWADEAKIVNITPPNLTFDSSMSLYIGGRQLELLYFGKAHTSGDVFIHIPDEKLLFTGDVIQDRRVPYLGDSYPAEWPETDDKISELPIDIFVSGHGPNGTHDDLLEAKSFIHDLVDSSKEAIQEGRNTEQATESVIGSLTDRYGNWGGFDTLDERIPEVIAKLS